MSASERERLGTNRLSRGALTCAPIPSLGDVSWNDASQLWCSLASDWCASSSVRSSLPSSWIVSASSSGICRTFERQHVLLRCAGGEER